MDLDIVKVACDLMLAAVSVGVLVLCRGRAREELWLRRFVLVALVARAAAGLGLHLLAPESVTHSDAAVYYVPQALAVLEGRLPYRDFTSSYGPLFPYVLAPLVVVWPRPGAAVAIALLAEVILIVVYLRRARGRPDAVAHQRAAWLYLSSPITVQWVALTGYNTVLVAACTLVALVLAERGRHAAAAAFAVLGLWAVKLLALLAWPAVAWCRSAGSRRRTWLLGAGAAALAALPLVGLDSWQPVREEAGRYSGGNVWFLLLVAAPDLHGSMLLDVLPPAMYLVGLLACLARHRRALAAGQGAFDAGAALVGAAGLLLMALSKKSFPTYWPLVLPFALHTLAVRDRLDRLTLLALGWLGASTTWQVLPQYLGDMLRSGHFTTSNAGVAELTGQAVTLASTVVLLAAARPGELTSRAR